MNKKYIKDYIPDDTKEGSYRYVGEYYFSSYSKEERVKSAKKQLLFGGFSLLILFLLLFIPGMGTRTLYVVIPLEIMLICFAYYCTGSFALLSVEDRMEKRFYDKAYENPIQMLTIALILEFLSISGLVIGVFILQGITPEDTLLFSGLTVHLVFSFFVWNRQRREMEKVGLLRE